jgi:hypothetical protein
VVGVASMFLWFLIVVAFVEENAILTLYCNDLQKISRYNQRLLYILEIYELCPTVINLVLNYKLGYRIETPLDFLTLFFYRPALISSCIN